MHTVEHRTIVACKLRLRPSSHSEAVPDSALVPNVVVCGDRVFVRPFAVSRMNHNRIVEEPHHRDRLRTSSVATTSLLAVPTSPHAPNGVR